MFVEIRHFHLFAGLGGGARGFNAGQARLGPMQASFRCLGGVDIDRAAMADFERLSGAPGTVLDLFDREQYRAFNGAEPPSSWREATPQDIQRAAGGERPHIVFLSAPCKGFSGLLSESKSRTAKYQALNRLTLRGVWLMLEAWADDPPELVLFENVPRLATRGRALLDQITAMLRAYGYATAETVHDCGELGGLAQSRKRFLLVARHLERVPPMLYQPERRPLRAVGDVLGRMLPPGDPRAGPMHRTPALQWKTWVRLAFVQAGSDWRSLNRLAVAGGVLRDYLIVPAVHGALPGAPADHAVSDPRFAQSSAWRDGQAYGRYSVADPRHIGPPKHSNEFAVIPWAEHARAITGAHGSGACVSDPRPVGDLFSKYPVTSWSGSSGTVIAGSTTGQGAFAVADPRSGLQSDRASYATGGHYGVLPWSATAGAVSAAACHDNGRWSVADPRLPAASDHLVAVIRAEDGTWHRPFTTLELAALQSLIDPEEQLELDGLSDSAWRERIGNAVPADSAQAIASEMGRTLLAAWSGQTFSLSSAPVWVRPVAVALSMAQGGTAQ